MACTSLMSCAPITIQTGVSASPQSAALTPSALDCSGTTFGTLTKAAAHLTVTIKADGTALGTFTNNGTVFQASGLIAMQVTQPSVNLSLDSHVQGGATGLLGVKQFGVGANVGSTGTITAVLSNGHALTGTFKGVQGTDHLIMTCQVQ